MPCRVLPKNTSLFSARLICFNPSLLQSLYSHPLATTWPSSGLSPVHHHRYDRSWQPTTRRHRVRPVAGVPDNAQCHLFSNNTLPKPTLYIDNLYNKLAEFSCWSRSPNLPTAGFVFLPSNPMTVWTWWATDTPLVKTLLPAILSLSAVAATCCSVPANIGTWEKAWLIHDLLKSMWGASRLALTAAFACCIFCGTASCPSRRHDETWVPLIANTASW